MVVLVMVMAIVVAGAWRNSVDTNNSKAFDALASGVRSTLATSLERDTDLLNTARTLVESEPNMTNAEFKNWFQLLGLQNKYPASIGVVYVDTVPASGLQSYEAAAAADPPFAGPPFNIAPSQTFTITPPGTRPYYCFFRLVTIPPSETKALAMQAASSPALSQIVDPGYDYCAGSSSVYTQQVKTGSLMSVEPFYKSISGLSVSSIPKAFLLGGAAGPVLFSVPVYQGGVQPTTPSQREQQWTGLVVGLFNGTKLLQGSTVSNQRIMLDLSWVSFGGQASEIAKFGHAPAGAMTKTLTFYLDGTWRLRISAVAPGGVSANDQALVVIFAGLAVSFLLFLILHQFARSRRWALELVEERTGELHHLALHDPLTGMPNRTLILDRTEHMLALARREGLDVALLFVDLDGFKDVNDTLGHAAGDQLLRSVATRFAGTLRVSDTVGRLGGDEFVILAQGISLAAGPELVAERLLDVLREPFYLLGHEEAPVTISASIGIAHGMRSSAEEMLRDSDVALYAAKAGGKNTWVVFAPEMQAAVETRRALEADLRAAIELKQFFLMYQPTFNLTDMSVNGVEALIRWNHPRYGVVLPGEFIPCLEDSGMIIDVGRGVLNEACRQAREWELRGKSINVSVNVSARQFESPDLVDDIRGALARSGLRPESLTIEITETTLMRDNEEAVQKLRLVKDLGVGIAIDDFGTGYCSLAYLQQFPVDSLKIDRTFVTGIAESSESDALLHTLIQLGKALHLETLAEGIEEPTQLTRLQAEQCDKGQGFLFARPLMVTDIERFFVQEASQVLTPT